MRHLALDAEIPISLGNTNFIVICLYCSSREKWKMCARHIRILIIYYSIYYSIFIILEYLLINGNRAFKHLAGVHGIIIIRILFYEHLFSPAALAYIFS